MAAAAQVQQSFIVSRANQTITFGTIANKTFDQSPLTVSATASSGLTVTFSSATTTVCTVAGTSVTFVKIGTCTINANQAGNGTYNAAPQVSQSFTIGKGNQSISFGAAPSGVVVGATRKTVSATASSGLVVTYSSTTSSICSVNSSSGALTLLAVGTCKIAGEGTTVLATVTLSSGHASFSKSNFSRGNHTVTATYTPSDSTSLASSGSVVQHVN